MNTPSQLQRVQDGGFRRAIFTSGAPHDSALGRRQKRKERNVSLFGSLAALLLLLVSGCLTSHNPFYLEQDIIQDQRFVGTFASDDSELKVTICDAGILDKCYYVDFDEGGKSSDYRATLFKIGDSIFVDLIPTNENAIVEQYREGAPTVSGLLRYISHDGKVSSLTRLHILFRVSLSEQKLVCFGARKSEDPLNHIAKDSGLKSHDNGDGTVLDESTARIRSLVERYSGTNWIQLFQPTGLTLTKIKVNGAALNVP